MEIGSFIGLDLRNNGEYYSGEANVARLNSARTGIYHACRLLNCVSIHIPYYLCPTVKKFVSEHGIKVNQYFINDNFEPADLRLQKGEAVLLVNYFGIMSSDKIKSLASRFENVIIDNSAAFYSEPIDECINVYSPRKFFGVPDGCYVIGNNADINVKDYKQDFSSPTASFLLKRLEYSTSETYGERMRNEERIDRSGILKMSRLTRSLLSNIDYSYVKEKRQKNFHIAHDLFHKVNKVDPTMFEDGNCVPMVYPLVIEQTDLNDKLKENSIYTGRWWKSVLSEVPTDTFESWLSKYMIPTPIDQRYDMNTINQIHNIIINL